MIDRETKDLRLEICPQNKRSEKELKFIIKKHVKPGGKLITDGWRAYNWIKNESYGQHLVINHTENYVHPNDPGSYYLNKI